MINVGMMQAMKKDEEIVSTLLLKGESDSEAIMAALKERRKTAQHQQRVKDLTEQYLAAEERAYDEYEDTTDATLDAKEQSVEMDEFHVAKARELASRRALNEERERVQVAQVAFEQTGSDYDLGFC